MNHLRISLDLFICFMAVIHTCLSEKCTTDTFQSGLATRTECFRTHVSCGFSNLQRMFPGLFNKTGWRREPPMEPKVMPFCKLDQSGVNQAGLNIQWKLPSSGSAEGVRGYELRIEGNPFHFRCLVIVLEETITQQNVHLEFHSSAYPVSRLTHFKVVLHSLPRANDSEVASRDSTSMNCDRGASSSNWTPTRYNDTYNWQERTLTVWFSAPPEEFNITEFKLDLVPKVDPLGFKSKQTNTTVVLFTNVDPGKYKLYLEPYNKDPHSKGMCICRDDENRCQSCQQSVWDIDAPLAQTSQEPLTESRGQGQIPTLVTIPCAFVAMVIVLVLAYKVAVLAKRFGITLAFGNNKNRGSDDRHLLICVDASSSPLDAAKLQNIVENVWKDTIIFKRLIYDDDLSSNMASVVRNLKIPAIENNSEQDTLNSSTAGNPEKGCQIKKPVRIVICLLISDASPEMCTEMLSNIYSSIPRNGSVFVHMCAVTFRLDTLLSAVSNAKLYCLEPDKQIFILEVNKAISKQTDTAIETDESVASLQREWNPVDASQNGFKVNGLFGPYVALPKSGTENNGSVIRCPDCIVVDGIARYRVPEVVCLSVPGQGRERYVSSDSGRGGSELSYRPSHSPDDINSIWAETDVAPSEMEYHHLQTTNQAIGRCPSCDISFFPPDPSVNSEADFVACDIEHAVAGDGQKYDDIKTKVQAIGRKAIQKTSCSNCLENVEAIPLAGSMDSLMEKMAQINERSAFIMQENNNLGEVHSVWEGHV